MALGVFGKPLGQMQVMQIRQGAITNEIYCLSGQLIDLILILDFLKLKPGNGQGFHYGVDLTDEISVSVRNMDLETQV